MNTYEKLQACLAGRFNRIDYTDKHIAVNLCGALNAETLTPEQIDWVKGFYNKPNALVEIVSVKPYIHKLLRLVF